MKFLLGAAFLLFLPVFALADTDYACLKGCNSLGTNLSTCTDRCTYDTPESFSGKIVQLDKICFRNCVEGSSKATVCLPQCSTVAGSTTTRKEVQRTTEDKHDQLDAPKPFADLLLKPARRPPEPVRDMDYSCLNTCAHGGLKYELCSQRCVK